MKIATQSGDFLSLGDGREVVVVGSGHSFVLSTLPEKEGFKVIASSPIFEGLAVGRNNFEICINPGGAFVVDGVTYMAY